MIFPFKILAISGQSQNYTGNWTLENCIEYAKENNISTTYANGNGNHFYLPIGLSLGVPMYNNRIYTTEIEKSTIDIWI